MAYHAIDDETSFIDYICVKRQHRKTGIGSALLANVPKSAHLIVSALRPCCAFYARCGFSECVASPYAAGLAEQTMYAERIVTNREPVGRTSRWSLLTTEEQEEAVRLVKRSERASESAARHFFLNIRDDRMQFVIVD